MNKLLAAIVAVVVLSGCQTKTVHLETTSGETLVLSCVVDSVFTQPCYIKELRR